MDILTQKIDLINDYLNKYLSNESNYQTLIFDSMRYSIFAGGKRLRPTLMIYSYEAVGGTDITKVIPFACAIEMIHTYSLIHDDLPAMDNDDYRRGKLTNHKLFGEGLAILAGDGLLNLAFEIMTEACLNDNTQNSLKAMYKISKSSGVYGMVAGQVLDLESEHKVIDKGTLNFIHVNKTSAIIKSSLEAGAILAGTTESNVSLLSEAGYNLGMAFQIQDDILDITGNESDLGKPINSDSKNKKSTFVSLYGLEQSKLYVKDYSTKAIELFKKVGSGTDDLIELTEKLIYRNC